MDKKKIIKHVLFIIFIPWIIAGSYYGYKYIKKKIDEKKSKQNGN